MYPTGGTPPSSDSSATTPAGVDLGRAQDFALGAVSVSPSSRRVRCGETEVVLEPRVMQVLVALAAAKGRVVSRESLIESCWNGRVVGDDVINRAIWILRRTGAALGPEGFSIETVARVGYRLQEGSVRRGASRRPARAIAAVALILLLAGLAYAWLRSGRPAAARSEVTLAVLPFEDLSSEERYRHLGRGLAEEIMTALAAEPGIRVIGRSSVAALGPDPAPADVRTRLRASHMLEGSLRVDGRLVRINARLVATSNGVQVWQESFERQIDEVFALQEEVAAVVAARVRGAENRRPPRRPARRTSNEVYDLFLAANAIANRRNYEALNEARQLMRRATQLDPGYAPAWARLAAYEIIIDDFRPTGKAQESAERKAYIGRLLERALALDPDLAEAHAALGMLVWTDNPELAFSHHERAISLDPSNFLAWNNGGNSLLHLCRVRSAIDYFRRAAAIEPLLFVPYANWTTSLAALGEHRQAEAVAAEFLRISGNRQAASSLRAHIFLARGDLSAAARHASDAQRLGSTSPASAAALATSLQAMGLTESALTALPVQNRATTGAYWKSDYGNVAAPPPPETVWTETEWHAAFSNALLRTGRSRELLRRFNARYRTLEEFDRQEGCELPKAAIPLVLAFRQQGRAAEADRLLRLAKARQRQAALAGIRAPDLLAAGAGLELLAGRPDASIDQLRRAVTSGWVEQSTPAITLRDPVFDSLRARPEFDALERELRRAQDRERREWQGRR